MVVKILKMYKYGKRAFFVLVGVVRG